MIGCAEFEDRLNALLDERLPVEHDPLVQSHAVECQSCRSLLAAMHAVLGGTAALPIPEPPLLLGEVLSALRMPATDERELSPASSQQHRSHRVAYAALALAATVLVCGTRIWISTSAKVPVANQLAPTPPGHNMAVAPHAQKTGTQKASPAPSAVAQTPAPPLGVIAQQATDRYMSLAHDTSRRMNEAIQVVPPVPRLGADFPSSGLALLSSSTPSNKAITARAKSGATNKPEKSDWSSGWSEGLAPVTRSTSSALNAFRLAIPVPPEAPAS